MRTLYRLTRRLREAMADFYPASGVGKNVPSGKVPTPGKPVSTMARQYAKWVAHKGSGNPPARWVASE